MGGEFNADMELWSIIKNDSDLLNLFQNNAWFHKSIGVLLHSSTDLKSCVEIIADLAYALENNHKTRHMI